MMKKCYVVFSIILSSYCLVYSYSDSLQTDEQRAKDAIHSHRQAQYDQFAAAVISLYLFARRGEEAYLSVPREAFNKRLDLYKKVFPGIGFDPNIVRKELFIGKYLHKTGEYPTDEYRLKEAYDAYLGSCPQDSAPSFETVKPLLKSKALFTRDDVIQLHEQELKKHNLQCEKMRLKARAVWPVEEIKINGPGEECIAVIAENDSCVVTVQEFNNALFFIKMLKKFPLFNARKKVLKQLLSNKITAMQAHLSGLTEKENVRDKIQRWLYGKHLSESLRTMGSPVMNHKVVWEIYKSYYDQLFSSYEKVTLDIIGSTDSLWIDSIYQKVLNPESKDTVIKKRGKCYKQCDDLPCIRLESMRLPEIIVSPTDSLGEGEFTRPIKTPFGFFICLVVNVEKVKNLSFGEAQNQCVYIATRMKYLETMDTLVNEKAYQYYGKNLSQFTTPDTMVIQAWLLPVGNKDAGTIDNKIDSTKIYLTDTLSFRSMIISTLSLPEDERLKLEKKYSEAKKNRKTVDLIGPIQGVLGTWYFKIKHIKSGGSKIPFSLVKREIIDILYKPYLEMNADATNEDIKKLKLEAGFSKMYVSNMMNEVENLSEGDIQEKIDNGEIDTSSFDPESTDEMKVEEAREILNMQQYKKQQKMVQEWISSIQVNEEILKQ